MSDEFLAGILIGLLIGGFIATLAVALVTTGSDRSPRPPRKSSMRIDLLLDLHDADRYAKRRVAEANDIEQEMRELVRRYGGPSGS